MLLGTTNHAFIIGLQNCVCSCRIFASIQAGYSWPPCIALGLPDDIQVSSLDSGRCMAAWNVQSLEEVPEYV